MNNEQTPAPLSFNDPKVRTAHEWAVTQRPYKLLTISERSALILADALTQEHEARVRAETAALKYRWLARFDHLSWVNELLNDTKFNTLDAAVSFAMDYESKAAAIRQPSAGALGEREAGK